MIVPDTSVLFDHDKNVPVDQVFDETWEAYKSDFQLELVVPKTVRGELIHQHAKVNCGLLMKANDSFEKIERNTGKRYSHRATASTLETLAQQKIDRWIDLKGGRMQETPYASIDWAHVEHSAIHRIPPFAADDKSAPTEKGFRDAMILETLQDYCRQETRDVQIAFICADNLLRTTAETRLSDDHRVTCYESVDQFRSYCELKKRDLTVAFVKKIVGRASKKFFLKNDESTLYYQEQVRDFIRSEYSALLDSPNTWAEPPSDPVTSIEADTTAVVDAGHFYIAPALFQSIDEEGWYIWSSPVEFVKKYKRKLSLLSLAAQATPLIHVVTFAAVWRSRIATNGRFLAREILEIRPRKSDLRTPRPIDHDRYHRHDLTTVN
ncbi:MAG: DUF4935 domain-containing protein [Armatimonadetes bacterium]|nr:DUF4935 domain-containing protein [Armatimonadota bacterium]